MSNLRVGETGPETGHQLTGSALPFIPRSPDPNESCSIIPCYSMLYTIEYLESF